MLKLHNLKPKKKKKDRKRVGRGSGSGQGTYSGRGIKGQKARSGGNIRPGFEGGRTPMIRQIPKLRGFKSIHPDAQAVNLSDLNNKFKDGDAVTPKILQDMGMIDTIHKPVKILGSGELNKALKFARVSFSVSAREAVEKAGGQINEKKAKVKKETSKKKKTSEASTENKTDIENKTDKK